jgi:hypothetical protein
VTDLRQRRMAQNEASARRLNEGAEFQRPRNGGLPHAFICECVREHCTEALDLDIAEYINVRAHPRRFVVLPGHEEPEIESVIAVYDGYVVVQKRGEAGRLAEAEASG